jgi:hypothetical protein
MRDFLKFRRTAELRQSKGRQENTEENTNWSSRTRYDNSSPEWILSEVVPLLPEVNTSHDPVNKKHQRNSSCVDMNL